MDSHLDDLRAIFRVEAAGALDELAAVLEAAAIQRGARLKNVVASCFRLAHNIKGSAAIAEFGEIESLAHAMEDTLSTFRESEEPLPEEVVEKMLDSVTAMQRMLEVQGQEQSNESDNGNDAPAPARRPSMDDGAGAKSPTGRAKRPLVRVEADRLDRIMGSAGEMLLASARTSASSRALNEVRDDFFARLQDLPADERAAWRPFARSLDHAAHKASADERSFSMLTEEVNHSIKQLRMVPIAQAAPAWRKTVRETARQLNKRVRLAFEGEFVEIDRSVLERIEEPVMHLLRNSVAHGIEAPEDRVATGQAQEGIVLVKAYAMGASVCLEISDDGRGIDPQKVGDAAVSKGVVSKEELTRMSEDEVLDLIFASGFSTASEVDNISGRGVGLDVLRHCVLDLGGRFNLVPRGPLGGCTFELTLPVNLLSRRGMLVEVGSQRFALPVESVERVVRMKGEALETFEGARVIRLDGDGPVPVRRLGALMGMDQDHKDGWISAVILSDRGARLAVMVDRVVGDEELVVRQLPWNLRGTSGANGAAILSDGSLAVAVDVVYLFQQALDINARVERPPSAEEPAEERPRVLVADDSVTARTLQGNALTAAGFAVTMVSDGGAAWKALRQHRFDLLVSDIQMPVLDGIALTRRVRADSELQDLPIILVTTLKQPEDVDRGAEAGADEYVVKGKFAQQKLIEAAERILPKH